MRFVPALIALAAAAALSGCDARKSVVDIAPLRPVLVAKIHYEPRAHAEALPGVLKARVESDLGFRVSGRIEKRIVDVGAVVRKGDALALLDEKDLRLQLESAEADRGAAEAALTAAEADEKRTTSLTKQGWIAAAEFDKVKSAADQSRRAEDKAERAVSLARDALDYATLQADADGVVSATFGESGQVVQAGAPIIRLAHTDEMEAAVAVPEAYVERAKVAKASIEYWALPGLASASTLRELSPSADAVTRTYAARFRLPETPKGARLGMSVTVALADGAPPLARAPLSALIDFGAGPNVWVVDRASGEVSATPVTIAYSDADYAYLASGAAEGAEIVALGAHKIDPHEKVRVIDNLAGL